MGLFSKPEVVILKESSDAKTYLKKLEELYSKAEGNLKTQIQKDITITKAGIAGEDNILFELKNSNLDMVVLHDIYIETKDGLGAQIDFVVVCPKCIFIIECKNLFGNIEIDSKGNFIRTMEYGGKKHKEGIYSPITQNERHMSVLKECRAEEKGLIWGAAFRATFSKFYKSLVVLANPRTIVNDRYAKKEVKEQVLRYDQMIKVIKQLNSESKELASSKKDMMLIAESLLKRNIEERKDYYIKYQELLDDLELKKISIKKNEIPEEKIAIDKPNENTVNENTVNQDTVPVCPKCGAALILRTAKKGSNCGQKFYGCSNFPKCRYILNVK